MDDKWKLFLKELKELRVNYSDPNWFQAYSQLQNKIKLDETLNYNRAKKDSNEVYTGAFHFALNVQILSDDTQKSFIPFVFVLNNNEDKRETAKKWVDDSVNNKSVKYNYIDFFSDVRELINNNRSNISGLAEGEDLSEIAFDTSYSQTDEKYNIEKITLNAGNRGESSGIEITSEEIIKEINNLICELDKQDFITQISELYNNMGISNLHFAIYGLDGDYNSGLRLTHFFMVAEDPSEIKDFFFGYVRKIRDIASYIRTRYTYDLIQKNKWEAVKSAVASIMSRNMSHNLGSHYLYYTKKHLERLASELSIEQSPDIRGAALVLEYTQGRMDYLATIISNDKYPYGSVNFKSQIFDELTIDDFSKRHFNGPKKRQNRTVNYLLSNLIRSEDFTRPDIMTDGYQNPDNLDLLKLQIKYSSDGVLYKCFTGTNFVLDPWDNEEDFKGIPTIKTEEDIKRELSNIYIALPGGNMSCHAFFNVVENYIRNSAKYLREDFRRYSDYDGKSLTTNITLKFHDDQRKFIDIIIYDDKENATFYKLVQRTMSLDKKIQMLNRGIQSFFNGEPDIEYIRAVGPDIIKQIASLTFDDKNAILNEVISIVKAWQKECLFEQMCHRLSSIKILDKNSALDKENKGLKEMIFSTAWMRSYTFPQGKSYTDVIFDIQNEKDPDSKLKLIQDYCFTPVLVLENGEEISFPSTENIADVYYKPVCFGISFTLPLFRKVSRLDIHQDEATMIQKCLKTYSDIILANLDEECPIELRKVFPRLYPISAAQRKSENQILLEILRKRFSNFDDYWLSFGTKEEATGIHDAKHQIKFDHHMKDHVVNTGGLESQLQFAYSDSVSGGNFTKTMNELFDNGTTDDGTYKSNEDEFFALKIKESALTRITIIDERLSDSMEKAGSHLELSLKNIRLLNYRDTEVISTFTDLFKGNTFKDNTDKTNFLSIHLGLVEKIIQSTEFSNFTGDIPANKKAEKFMELLRENFGGDDVFISIHSGRGNFSAELEGPLAGYPFITMSSLESTFNNSKFLLSQLFYNTAYIGKGKINNHKQ